MEVITIKRKNNYLLILIMATLMVISIPVNAFAQRDLPNTAKRFYDHIISKGFSSKDAMYDPNTDEIIFVTRGATSTAPIRYRDIGYQFSVKVGNQTLWTVIPMNANKGLKVKHQQKVQENGREVYYTLHSIGFDSDIKRILRNEFMASGVSASDIDNIELEDILIDAVFIKVINGVPGGSLNSNGTIKSGNIYFTRVGVPRNTTDRRFDSGTPRATTADIRDKGILGAAPWSPTAKDDISSHYGIIPKYIPTDISASNIKMYDKSGKEIKEYVKGEPFRFDFEITHISGDASVGVKPPRNPFATVDYKVSNEDKSAGKATTKWHIHPKGVGNWQKPTEATPWMTTNKDSIDVEGRISELFSKRGLNIANSNDIIKKTFKSKDKDLSLSGPYFYTADGDRIRDSLIDSYSEYYATFDMYHEEGQDIITKPQIDVVIKNASDKIIRRNTIHSSKPLHPGDVVKIKTENFWSEDEDIIITATISDKHDKFNNNKDNDSVEGILYIKKPDLSLVDLQLYDKDNVKINVVHEEKTYKADIFMKHEYGDKAVTNPVIDTVVVDSKGNELYKQRDKYIGDLLPKQVVKIKTNYFPVKKDDITITSTIVRNEHMDKHNKKYDNDTVKKKYIMGESIDNYFIKEFTSATKSISLPGPQGANKDINFTIDIGHKMQPFEVGNRTPSLVLKKDGSTVWSGSVYMPNNQDKRVTITVPVQINSGVNEFSIEVNEDREIKEFNPKVSDPYIDNKASFGINAFYAKNNSNLYARTKWSRDMGYNDLPSEGKGWMNVGNGGTIKVKAGNGFETLFKTEFDYSPGPRERYISDNEKSNTKIVVPSMSLTLDNTYDNGSGFRTRRDYQLPYRRVVNGVSERKIYTSLDDKADTHKVDIKSRRETIIESYTIETSCDEEGNCSSWRNYYTFPVYSYNDDYFFLEILPQDDLKSHRMK